MSFHSAPRLRIALLLFLGCELVLFGLTRVDAQDGVRCVPQSGVSLPPSQSPPAPVPGAPNQNFQGSVPDNSDLMKPLCPEGQVPVTGSAPKPAPPGESNTAVAPTRPQKGNPLLGSSTQSPGAAQVEKFLKFESVYQTNQVLQTKPKAKSDATLPSSAQCQVYENSCYYYAAAGLTSQSDGGGMIMSIDSPAYANPGAQGHSLNEISVQGGPNNGNIIEIGWTVSTDQNGDASPHIFVFSWADGNGTCYNACGWQQYSNTYYPGQDIGILKGREVYVGYAYYQGNWWAWFDNQWLGYFPGTIWNNTYTQAALTQWFGEVATTNPATLKAQMGDGILPPPPTAAHMSRLCKVDAGAWRCLITDKQILAPPTVSQYYDIRRVGTGEIRYGGPGQ